MAQASAEGMDLILRGGTARIAAIKFPCRSTATAPTPNLTAESVLASICDASTYQSSSQYSASSGICLSHSTCSFSCLCGTNTLVPPMPLVRHSSHCEAVLVAMSRWASGGGGSCGTGQIAGQVCLCISVPGSLLQRRQVLSFVQPAPRAAAQRAWVHCLLDIAEAR